MEPVQIQMDVTLGSPTRPSWRGRVHLLALLAAIPLLVLLVANADDTRARVGVVVYAAGLCSMLAVSTTYHRWVHTVRSRALWRRADHATIFAAIAGTTTPLCLTLLDTRPAIILLVAVWLAAIVGAAMKIAGRRRADRVGTAMYIGNGWAGLALAPALWTRGGVVPSLLIILGGVIYTLGAFGFSRRWPTLRPNVFSYHEVWHVSTITAAGAHLAAVWLITT